MKRAIGNLAQISHGEVGAGELGCGVCPHSRASGTHGVEGKPDAGSERGKCAEQWEQGENGEATKGRDGSADGDAAFWADFERHV